MPAPYQMDDIINFLREETGYRRAITAETRLDGDRLAYGADHHELIENYAKAFNVDITDYKWYFHTGEEGLSLLPIWRILFNPPSARVKPIDITVRMLLEYANSGKWQLSYPEHHLPKRRYDIILSNITAILFICLLAWVALSKDFP